MSHPRVVLLGRRGCHLCDDARAVVAAVCTDLGVDWAERDVDADAALTERYTDLVPVVQVDGQDVSYYTVPAPLLRRALT